MNPLATWQLAKLQQLASPDPPHEIEEGSRDEIACESLCQLGFVKRREDVRFTKTMRYVRVAWAVTDEGRAELARIDAATKAGT